MSLVVKVSVNDGPPIAILAAQRVMGGTNPDDENQYVVDAWSRASVFDQFEPVLSQRGLVHRYGDGALALVKKMSELL